MSNSAYVINCLSNMKTECTDEFLSLMSIAPKAKNLSQFKVFLLWLNKDIARQWFEEPVLIEGITECVDIVSNFDITELNQCMEETAKLFQWK